MRGRAPRNFSNVVLPAPITCEQAIYAESRKLLPGLVDGFVVQPRTYFAAIPTDMFRIIAMHLTMRRRADYLRAKLEHLVTYPICNTSGRDYSDPLEDYVAEMREIVGIPEVCSEITKRSYLIFLEDYILVVSPECTYVVRGGAFNRVEYGHSNGTYRTRGEQFPVYLGMGIIAWTWNPLKTNEWQHDGVICSPLEAPGATFIIHDIDVRSVSILPCGLTLCHVSRHLVNARSGVAVHIPQMFQLGNTIHRNVYCDDYGTQFTCCVTNMRAHHLGVLPRRYGW